MSALKLANLLYLLIQQGMLNANAKVEFLDIFLPYQISDDKMLITINNNQ